MSQISSNKQIAKNTLLLYFRLFITMVVGLYTSRVVLEELGEVDFGIYNVVAGVVILFSFINGAMSSATQRFLTFELGKGNVAMVKKIFGVSLTIHALIAVVIFVLAQTVGLWFIDNELSIPAHRMDAAYFVYQMAILTTCLNIMTIPYNATVIAHERMKFFAYVSIVEVLLKLGVAVALIYYVSDKLELYGTLMLSVSAVMFVVYYLFCRGHFPSARFTLVKERRIYKKLFSFLGWSLMGGAATMGASQGLNMMLNIFFGVAINAAVGVANQVNSTLISFVTSFQTAFRPSVVKLYAAGRIEELVRLINTSAKFSYLLLFCIATPIALNIDEVLSLWLVKVPPYAAQFSLLILLYSLFETLSGPLWMTMQAVGKIRNYQIVISLLFASNLLFSYIFLKAGFSPSVVFVIKAAVDIICLVARLLFIRHHIDFSISRFCKRVIIPVALVSVVSLVLPLVYLYMELPLPLIFTSLLFVVGVVPAAYIFALTPHERGLVRSKLKSRWKK